MGITILGYHISVIRKSLIKQPIISKKDLPRATYNKRPKTIKEHTGKLIAILIRLQSGEIKELREGTHLQVCEFFNIDPRDVDTTGWELDNGFKVWR